jgi:hypothetical protein
VNNTFLCLFYEDPEEEWSTPAEDDAYQWEWEVPDLQEGSECGPSGKFEESHPGKRRSRMS